MASIRLSFDAAVGRVATRLFSFINPRLISSSIRLTTSALFASWVLCTCDLTRSMPSESDPGRQFFLQQLLFIHP